jgi:flagellar hook-length control protein FliK
MSTSAPQPILAAPGREPIPSPTGSAPPGTPPAGPPFHSALETESARTATAEGQQQSRSQHSGHGAGPTLTGTEATAGLAALAPTPAGTAIPSAAPPPGRTPTNEPAPSAATGRDANRGAAARSNTSQPGPATARGGVLSGKGEGINARVAASNDDALPSSATSPPDGVLATPPDGTPTAGASPMPNDEAPTGSAAATSKDDIPWGNGIGGAPIEIPKNALTAGAGPQAHSTPELAPTGDLTIPHRSPASPTNRNAGDLVKTPSVPTPAAGTNADGMSGRVSGLETTASPLLGTALDGSPTASPAEPASGAYAVGLQEAIESLHGTIQLAARQGLTQARISLQPEELGEIRINLTQTTQGLLARVTAESPAAAQALAAAHAQLRQSLSSLGINLTRLDIGHHELSAQSGGTGPKGNGQGGAASGGESSGGRPNRADRSPTIAAPTDPGTEADSLGVEELAPGTTAPSNGTLIDVLA